MEAQVKAIILGAGAGTRMKSTLPKVLHPICGKPMIQILIQTIQQANIQDITVVVGPDMDNVKQAIAPIPTVVQKDRKGTAHAVLCAAKNLRPFDGCVLVLFGDTPLIRVETLHKMIASYRGGSDITVLGFLPPDARRYGRLIMGANGLEKIVEYKDATDEQRAIRLCNAGAMCLNGRVALSLLKKIKNNNIAQEFYLTDAVEIARSQKLKCDVVIGDEDELHGINTPDELETAQEIYMHRLEQK